MITGIGSITYGVADLDSAQRFLGDWGLQRVGGGAESDCRFETLAGDCVVARPAADPSLPDPAEAGCTLRQVEWRVSSEAELSAVVERVRDFTECGRIGEAFRFRDPNGLAMSLRCSRRRQVSIEPVGWNAPGNYGRIDRPSQAYKGAHPLHVGHVVLHVPDIDAAERFYTEALGFTVSDRYPGSGVFLRCSVEGDHHNLFLIKAENGKVRLNHVAFAVSNIHEVFGGGLHLSRLGWETELGPGRHPISSAYFWYFRNPCGGAIEYFADEDRLTANWKARNFERTDENFAEWAAPNGIPQFKRPVSRRHEADSR